MKILISKSLLRTILLTIFVSGLSASAFAGSGPAPLPQFPPVRSFEGPGPAPLPPNWPTLKLAVSEGLGPAPLPLNWSSKLVCFGGPGPMPTPQYPPLKLISFDGPGPMPTPQFLPSLERPRASRGYFL
jgi:hypothetical protein